MLRAASQFPDNIKEYVLLRVLGKGAFASVYEATLLASPANRFAIKIIDKKKIKSTNGMAQRVTNEVTIHHQLRHPNILELYHFFEDSENVYLIMELCNNGELYQYLRNKKSPLNEDDSRRFFHEIVKGVDYLHEHGIIHRDLKLSNILLDDSMKPKIADFGLAVRQNNPMSNEQKTLCGTPNYLAPEILLKRPYGAAADQWSLGCILYSFLVGRPPFESSEVKNTFEKVSKVEFYLPNWLSSNAKNLINNLIVHDPDSRLSTKRILEHPFLVEGIHLKSNPPTSPGSPLNTKWLRPLRQQTKHGIIELLGNGKIWIDFMIDPTISVIDIDGLRVRIFEKGTQQSQIDYNTPKEILYYPNLPLAKMKIYEYARKFVNLLRSKTPRVIISTAQFKAFLMDNGPTADFLLKYNDASKRLEYIAENEVLRLYRGNEVIATLKSPRSIDISSQALLSSDCRLLLSDFLGRYHQAIETCQKIRSNQDRETLPFPFVIREHVTADSGQTAFCQPTIQTMNLTELRTTRQQMELTPPIESNEFEIAYRTFQSRVGWCLASTSDQYLLLFLDGVSLLVDGRINMICYEGCGEKPCWFKIDSKSLPEYAKRKLQYFPKFVHLLKQQHFV